MRARRAVGLLAGLTVVGAAVAYNKKSLYSFNNFKFVAESKEKLYYKVKLGEKLDLDSIKPDDKAGREKETTQEENLKIQQKLGELQELFYAAGTHALLVVVQGQDTSGKDGLCRRVFSQFNPSGLRVESFKEPTDLELSHDYLWRIHQVMPAKRNVTVINRSHYEDVVVPTIHGKLDDKTSEQRYKQIENFERLLVENGTIIVKLYLHISDEEQEARLLARQQRAIKAWKLSAEDWDKHSPKNRKAFGKIYETLLSRTSTKEAPWYIIPADRKWFRDLSTGNVLLETLEPYRNEWVKATEKFQKKQLPPVQKAQKEVEKEAGVKHKRPEDVESKKDKKKRQKKDEVQKGGSWIGNYFGSK